MRDVLQGKGGEVWTTREEATVYEAIGVMGEKNIGALVVVDEGGKVVGILSERDYSRKVVLKGRTSRDTRVGEVLSRPAVAVPADESVVKCMHLMTKHRIRHLPVTAEDALVGVISMGDLVKWVIESQSSTIRQLQGYISGDYPG